jgi:photosystem II stability/assembly factor-like uncharacterized protein
LLTATGGWALSDSGLALTVDGGSSWVRATPSSISGSAIAAIYFLTPETGWLVAVPQQMPSTSVKALVYSTRDGGRAWSSKSLVITITGAGMAGMYLTFADTLHGWLVVDQGSHGGFNYAALYRTKDGGNSWESLPVPQSAPLLFINPLDGYSAGGLEGAGKDTFVTHDGGTTWHSFGGLPLPPGCNCAGVWTDLPVITRSGLAVLPSLFVNTQHETVAAGFYVSSDGGRSWVFAGSHPNLDPLVTNLFPLGVLDEDNWMITVARPSQDDARLPVREIWLTHDSGKTWTISSTLLPTAVPTEMSFVNSLEGWAVMAESGCLGVKTDCYTNTGLFQTVDGGESWRQLAPPG